MSEPNEYEQEAAYDEFVDSLGERFREEAFEDETLYGDIVADFATGRLRSDYVDHPEVLAPAYRALLHASQERMSHSGST